MKKRVAILISGGGSNMYYLIKSMKDNHPAYPVLVFSNNPEAAGIDSHVNLELQLKHWIVESLEKIVHNLSQSSMIFSMLLG